MTVYHFQIHLSPCNKILFSVIGDHQVIGFLWTVISPNKLLKHTAYPQIETKDRKLISDW